jgi:hypothetical protein
MLSLAHANNFGARIIFIPWRSDCKTLIMPDPLSIATGILALLNVTGTIANELKKFHEGANVVSKTIADLENDVASFSRVLESMRETFEHITAEGPGQTGHIGSLWNNVARSVQDSKDVLSELQKLILDISRDSTFLDEHRKQLRLNRAEEKIARYRLHIQSYRDGLQLSLQTIILVSQVSSTRATEEKVLPGLSQLHEDVRRIAADLNQRIGSLQAMVRLPEDEARREATAMQNLRDCVRSAASTISSATSLATVQEKTLHGDTEDSEFGDNFPAEQGLALRRFLDSRTVYDYQQESSTASGVPQSVADVRSFESDDSADSDDELHGEMAGLL